MPERKRTHTWTDPAKMFEEVGRMSGAEFFREWASGELTPPIAAALGFHLEDHEEGRVVIGCTPEEFHYNPYGTVHGGLISTLLDTATGCAIHTRLPEGAGYATINLEVSFLRPVTIETGKVRGVGEVISLGRRVAVSEGHLLDGDGKKLARATSHCAVFEAR